MRIITVPNGNSPAIRAPGQLSPLHRLLKGVNRPGVGSNQYDVLKVIKEKHPGKRVVVATGQESIREAIKVFRLGALDYFPKDFQRNVLSTRVFAAIQKQVKVLT